MEGNRLTTIMLAFAGLLLTLSLGLLTTANQAFGNQNDIAIFNAEARLIHNVTNTDPELINMTIINNKITKDYINTCIVLFIVGWICAFVAVIPLFNWKGKDSRERDASEKIKDLFLDMFRGFPNYRYRRDIIENIIVTEVDRKDLIEKGYLLKEDVNDTYTYRLGASALPLISAWKSEKINQSIFNLTWLAVIIAVVAIITTIVVATLGK